MDLHYDNTAVRRQDRLMAEQRAVETVINGEYGFLALAGAEGGYGVPLNYAAEESRLYFHCAPQGEKLRRIGEECRACFCIVGRTAPHPSRFTTDYESVMIFGRLTVVEDDAERMHALDLLVGKYSPGYAETGRAYAAKSFGRTCILRMDIARSSGKCKRTIPSSVEK